ncbi:hypothetical protein DBR47_07625 [Paucibacter sp. KBW04]|uniref:hypothetical protein n=1 Tax=Paucibacter sp. KBW04 TaxID=2153361 RepID=UPI000F58DCF3|nr:hypothetical protein [Paucibacter sp. KBW04]RQO61102.1 hypothetical protein DBR47_07625 [Paucibacter sp. KBW04]
MTEPKDGESFFRKVARFVANPTTDWAEINSRQDDPEGDQAKAELRAMVDRKRRNDFVRKRELDMLRRIRREGLSPEQLAALGSSSSRIDEIERSSEINSKIDLGVKAKIDQIEQQMVGESFAPTLNQPLQATVAQPPAYFETTTRPVNFAPTVPAGAEHAHATLNLAPSFARVSEYASADERERLELQPPHAAVVMGAALSPLSDAKSSRLPDLPLLDMPLTFSFSEAAPVEPQELAHDAELDEAVIAFANADNDSCERILAELIRPGGARNLQGSTWLVLFDLYRATGQQAKFETLALEFAQIFGRSAPQWFSMPKLVAEAQRKVRPPMAKSGGVSWTAPEVMTLEAVQQLRSRSLLMPMPWVMDWAALHRLELDAAPALRELFREWATQALDMRWLSGDHLLQLLRSLTPVSAREIDTSLWMLRLEALRLANRPDQFDEAAIDYCVTYEVSPPSWERCACRVRVSGSSVSTQGPLTSTAPTEAGSSFMDSQVAELGGQPGNVELELCGQLSGDISPLLNQMTEALGNSAQAKVLCGKLIRLDFMAAGDLLNWVLARQSENRAVSFTDTHRLVALFFAAMGINEHAKIKVRQT